MLNFFRKYQWYFFLVITVVIIISFSFFGTYNTLGSNQWREQIAFTAVNGHEVPRSDVDDMARFIATDNEDKLLYGGAWGPNFLNDGVIRNDFLAPGLATELALAYAGDLSSELNKRLAKEKKFTLYSHPQAPFVSMKGVWGYFMPEMQGAYDALMQQNEATGKEAFDARTLLFLGERQIPPSLLRRILFAQQQQYSWLKPDERLNQTDLSLFGYHTVEDWFSPQFTRLLSEFIINAALLAEAQGYRVTEREALADLVRNATVSYEQNINNPNLGVRSPDEYMREQLNRLNMDPSRAVKLWQQVLLFRRYFQDAGSLPLVDALLPKKLAEFSGEVVTADLYQLPKEMQLASLDDLYQFEAYLYAVAKQNKADPLEVPQQFLALDDVEKKYPELVQKSYVINLSKTTQKALQAQIGLKELWNWEVDEKNWGILTKQFPTLAMAKGESRDARFATLDALDAPVRSSVDAFAKKQIVAEHPEWVEKALSENPPKKVVANIRTKGGELPVNGLNDEKKRKEFTRLLDNAEAGELALPTSPLYRYTPDEQNYYRIAVIEKGDKGIVPFKEVKADGTMESVLTRLLEKHYVATRGDDPASYQDDKKEWKPLKEVRGKVANHLFAKQIEAVGQVKIKGSQEKRAPVHARFYPHLNGVREELVVGRSETAEPGSLGEQWRLKQLNVTLSRASSMEGVDIEEALTLSPGKWSQVSVSPDGNVLFYRVRDKSQAEGQEAHIAEETRGMQELLGAEAKRHLMQEVIGELKAKNAISLAYLRAAPEDLPEERDASSLEAMLD